MTFLVRVIAFWVMCCVMSGVAHAEERIPAEHFYPRDPATGTLGTEHPSALEHLVFSASLVLHWVDDPLVINVPAGIRGDESARVRLIDQALQLDNTVSVGLWDRLTISAAIPLVIFQRGDALEEVGLDGTDSPVGFGEPRFGVKLTALELGMLGIAVEGKIFLPGLVDFRSETMRIVPNLIVGLTHERFRLSTNVGWEFRDSLSTETYTGGDRLAWSLGGDVRVIKGLRVGGSAFGTLDVERDSGPANALEVLGSLSYEVLPGLTLSVGAGAGLAEGVGSPGMRLLGGVAYGPPRQDADGDGVVLALDRCPDEPEDFDGFEDEDGCPDPDNDGDGIPDELDMCPDLPEDFDGFEDEDGCPDPDNDQDGIPDDEDDCPMVPGIPELRGCPESDTDGDGIPDHLDACPNEPEDFDGFEDEDGCPDPDNDRDGIPDAEDECPLVPGVPEFKGCPDEGPSKIRLRGSRLEIGERVYFDTGSDRIQPRSYPILRQMAAVLRTQVALRKIRVSGHTDSRGDDAMNLDLSERRAASVKKFLIDEGIQPERLESRGFGESHPVDTNENARGREMNRRVEFHILERDEP